MFSILTPRARLPLQDGDMTGTLRRAFVAATSALFAVPLAVGCASPPEEANEGPGEPETMTCEQLGAEAASVSVGEAIELLKVRELQEEFRRRFNYEPPKGAEETLLLSCTGTGVWSDGQRAPVEVRLTMDADGDRFVWYDVKQ